MATSHSTEWTLMKYTGRASMMFCGRPTSISSATISSE